MKQKINILLINFFYIVLLFLLSGCDNSKQVPDPPLAETALVTELLFALKNKDYQLAEKKIQRLKAMDSEDLFLENIQTRLKNNKLISQAQKMLDSGNIDKAIESLSQSISVEGENSSLVGALNQLETLKNIKQLTENILKSESSREIAINSGKLNRAINTYPSAKKLANFSGSKLNHARSLLAVEKSVGIEDLRADIDIAWVKGRPYLNTMIASLEVEDSESPEVLAYIKAMQENWMDDKISEIYINPEQEILFFRKGLLLSNNAERRDIYDTLLYLPPNNFRSMLIKAILLKFAGYSKESSAITKQISNYVSAPSSIVKKWFQLTTDSSIGINKINPFVLFPFFIYFDYE